MAYSGTEIKLGKVQEKIVALEGSFEVVLGMKTKPDSGTSCYLARTGTYRRDNKNAKYGLDIRTG